LILQWKKISRKEKIPEHILTSSITTSKLIPQEIISHLKKNQLIYLISIIQLTYLVTTLKLEKISHLEQIPVTPLMLMIQLTSLVMTLNLIPLEKNQPSGTNPSDPSDVNDSIDLFGNDIEPDHAGKHQPSGTNPSDPSDVDDSIDLFGNDIEPDTAGKNQLSGTIPSDPSDVNDSIDLFGNNVEPDHNLKISSTHATDNVDNPGKNQSKRKIPGATSKVTSDDDIGNKGLPEKNHSNNPTGNESNTEKNGLEGETQNDNNAPTDVSKEDDNNEKVDPLFAKPEVFVTKVVDLVIQIHMVEIALFLYGNKTTMVGQPLVNHCPLFVSNMKSRDFLDKM
jgi:hypothetical protein